MHYLNTVVLDKTTRDIYPQVDNMGMHDPARDVALRGIPNFAKATTVPPLTFNLDRKTLLTDLVSQAYVMAPGMLISQKLVQCLESYSIQRHSLYPATVNYDGASSDYRWLHFIENIADAIDFGNSEFLQYDMLNKPLGKIEFTSKDDFEEQCRTMAMMLSGSLVPQRLHFGARPVPDLFALHSVEVMLYVSDPLAESLRSAGTTGLQLRPSKLVCVAAD